MYPLAKPPILKSVMTPFPYTIGPEQTLRHAKAMMAEHRIHHLPVADNGKLLGIISERDIRWALDPIFDLGSEDEVPVESVFRRNVYACDLHTRLDEALTAMAENHYGSVLVTKHGKLAGIFTYTDACREFADYLSKRFPLEPVES